MFDDPRKSLLEMEQALKEAEMDPVPEEEDWLQEYKDLLGEDEETVPVRNQANHYGRATEAADIPRTVYDDEQMEEKDTLYVEKPKRKGAGGLVVLALLELIAMVLVVLWWVKWTL